MISIVDPTTGTPRDSICCQLTVKLGDADPPGVVDQDIEPVAPASDFLGDPAQVSLPGHVRGERIHLACARLPSQLGGRCCRTLRVATHEDDIERSDGALDAFTADLITHAAVAALDTVSREWLRTGGRADRSRLLDRAFAALRPASATGPSTRPGPDH